MRWQPALASLRRHALPCLGLLLVGAALFGRVPGFDFVQYDDHELLVRQSAWLARPSFVLGAFWQDAFGVLGPGSQGIFYRPLLLVSYGLEAQLRGPDPVLAHATNVTLHLLATLLAYLLFAAFGASRALAFALAAVFCCHPSAVLVAAWIPCRNESLLAIASIGSVLALLDHLRTRRRTSLALCLALYAAALFTKESGVALLPVLVATALVAGGRALPRRELALAAAGALAISAGWAALRLLALGGGRIGLSSAAGNLSVLLVYLGKTFAPLGLAAVPHPDDTATWPGVVAGLVLLAAIVSLRRRLFGPAGIGLVWYGAFLLPTLLVPRETWGLEHRIYLPLVGMLLFVWQLGATVARRLPSRVGVSALIAAAAGFALVSARRLPDFSGPIVYWESAARAAPHSAFAASRLAWRYVEAERYDAAIAAVDRSLAPDAERFDLQLVRGVAAAGTGDWSRAERDIAQAVSLEPENPTAWEYLARAQRALGREQESRASRRKAEELGRRE